jgi:hypothetical protein
MGKRVGAMPAEVNSVAFNSGKEKKKEEEYKKDKRNKRKLTLQRDRKEKGKMGKSIRETLGEEREEENEDQDEDIIMTSSYFSLPPPSFSLLSLVPPTSRRDNRLKRHGGCTVQISRTHTPSNIEMHCNSLRLSYQLPLPRFPRFFSPGPVRQSPPLPIYL